MKRMECLNRRYVVYCMYIAVSCLPHLQKVYDCQNTSVSCSRSRSKITSSHVYGYSGVWTKFLDIDEQTRFASFAFYFENSGSARLSRFLSLTIVMFVIQEVLLRLFGLLPHSTSNTKSCSSLCKLLKCVLTTVAPIFAIFYLLGCCYSTVLHCLTAVWEIVLAALDSSDPKPDNPNYSLLHLLSVLPFSAMHVRGFVALLSVFLHRHEWRPLKCRLYDTLVICFPDSSDRYRLIQKWKKRSMALSLLTLGIQIGWEIGDWVFYSSKFPTTNEGFYWQDMYSPVPFKFATWKYFSLYIAFGIFPFLLSQQILTCLLVFCGMMSDALQYIRSSMLLELSTLNVDKGHQLDECSSLKGNAISVKTSLWEIQYTAILQLLREVNGFFSTVVFIIYAMDSCSMLGFGSRVANTGSVQVTTMLYYFMSAVVFLIYCTVLLSPLVSLYEVGLELPQTLQQLAVAVGGVQRRSIGCQRADDGTGRKEKSKRDLQDLANIMRQNHCMVTGGNVLFFTRTLLVTSVASTVSLVILIKELVDGATSPQTRNTEIAEHCQCVSNITNLTSTSTTPTSTSYKKPFAHVSYY